MKTKITKLFFIPIVVLQCFYFCPTVSFFAMPEWTIKPVTWTWKPLPTIKFTTTTKKPNTIGPVVPENFGLIPVVPENFGFVSSKVFEVNGEKHEQSVFYDARKKEAILFSPAHAGYPDITTVLTSKKGNQKAQSLTCDNKVCHLNDVQDELFMNPEVIAAVYEKKEEDKFQGRARRISQSPVTKTKYVVRSDHRALDENELKSLPESMKNIGQGKKILSSSTTVQAEKPNQEFSFGFGKRALFPFPNAWCQVKYGCGSTNEYGCSWSFEFTDAQDVHDVDGNFQVHSIYFDRYCIHCCGNTNSYPNNRYVLCDDITKPSSYYARREAFSSAVAVTFKEKYGPASISCADMFPKYLPHCKHYGNGYYGEGLGACVKDDVDDCPPERTPPLTWN